MSAGVVLLIVIGAIVVAGAVALAIAGQARRERAADLAAEFWDWLKLGH